MVDFDNLLEELKKEKDKINDLIHSLEIYLGINKTGNINFPHLLQHCESKHYLSERIKHTLYNPMWDA
jgi:hypothetical protein